MPSKTKSDGRRSAVWNRSIVKHRGPKDEKGMISRLKLKVVKRPAKNESGMIVYTKPRRSLKKSSFGRRTHSSNIKKDIRKRESRRQRKRDKKIRNAKAGDRTVKDFKKMISKFFSRKKSS